jgi:hypothetical protein
MTLASEASPHNYTDERLVFAIRNFLTRSD